MLQPHNLPHSAKACELGYMVVSAGGAANPLHFTSGDHRHPPTINVHSSSPSPTLLPSQLPTTAISSRYCLFFSSAYSFSSSSRPHSGLWSKTIVLPLASRLLSTTFPLDPTTTTGGDDEHHTVAHRGLVFSLHFVFSSSKLGARLSKLFLQGRCVQLAATELLFHPLSS